MRIECVIVTQKELLHQVLFDCFRRFRNQISIIIIITATSLCKKVIWNFDFYILVMDTRYVRNLARRFSVSCVCSALKGIFCLCKLINIHGTYLTEIVFIINSEIVISDNTWHNESISSPICLMVIQKYKIINFF